MKCTDYHSSVNLSLFLFNQNAFNHQICLLRICAQLERLSESLSAFEAFAIGCVEHLEESFPLPSTSWQSTLGLPMQNTWQWTGSAPLLSPATALPPPHPYIDVHPQLSSPKALHLHLLNYSMFSFNV